MSQAFHEEINYDPEVNLTTQDLATLSLDKEIPDKIFKKDRRGLKPVCCGIVEIKRFFKSRTSDNLFCSEC